MHVRHVNAYLSRKLDESGHQKNEREDEHHRHDLPVPYAQKSCEKGENKQRGSGERA